MLNDAQNIKWAVEISNVLLHEAANFYSEKLYISSKNQIMDDYTLRGKKRPT